MLKKITIILHIIKKKSNMKNLMIFDSNTISNNSVTIYFTVKF